MHVDGERVCRQGAVQHGRHAFQAACSSTSFGAGRAFLARRDTHRTRLAQRHACTSCWQMGRAMYRRCGHVDSYRPGQGVGSFGGGAAGLFVQRHGGVQGFVFDSDRVWDPSEQQPTARPARYLIIIHNMSVAIWLKTGCSQRCTTRAKEDKTAYILVHGDTRVDLCTLITWAVTAAVGLTWWSLAFWSVLGSTQVDALECAVGTQAAGHHDGPFRARSYRHA